MDITQLIIPVADIYIPFLNISWGSIPFHELLTRLPAYEGDLILEIKPSFRDYFAEALENTQEILAMAQAVSLWDSLVRNDVDTLSRQFRWENRDILVDEFYARQNELGVGDTVEIFDKEWRVCGIVEPGKMAHWIAAPARGINGKPLDFEYVRRA